MGRRVRFCAVDEDKLAITQDTPWRDRQGKVLLDLLWHVDRMNLPGLMASALIAEAELAWGHWNAASALRLRRTNDRTQAHIIMQAGRIDGPGGTLAWSNLPPTYPVMQLYDTGERSWDDGSGNGIHVEAVICHEGGHALGLLHDDERSGSLMAPYYKKSIHTPQPRDVQRIRALYGNPTVPPGPGDPTDPAGKPYIIRIWNPTKVEVEGPDGPYRVIPAW